MAPDKADRAARDRAARDGAIRELAAGKRAVVAWDTCTLRGVLAVGAGGELLAETRFEARKGHSTWLMPELDSTLSGLGIERSSIGYLAVGTGPGTFTGVKVGVACGKAMSLGMGVPLLGIGTLDIIAESAPVEADLVLSTIDARRGEYYAAVFKRAGDGSGGELRRVTAYVCGTPDELARALLRMRYRRLSVAGEAPPALLKPLERRGAVLRPEKETPDALALIRLADTMFSAGMATDAASVNPVYLKKPV